VSAPGAPEALRLSGVSAAYGPYRALFDVSLGVEAGQAVALLGSNGAGKSTVARVASGLVVPTSGSLFIGGTEMTGSPTWRIARAGVAHVPEGRGVFSALSIEENLELAFGRRAGKGAGAALARAYDEFPLFYERRRQRAGTLSGGQQRLLSLAGALVQPPALLIADELSLGLSPSVVDDVYTALGSIQRAGCALRVVEQQIDRVLELAVRAVILERGSVAFAGPSNDAPAAMASILAARGERSLALPGTGHSRTE